MKTHLQIGFGESTCVSGKKKGIEMGPKFDGEHLHNLPSVSPNKQFFPAPIFFVFCCFFVFEPAFAKLSVSLTSCSSSPLVIPPKDRRNFFWGVSHEWTLLNDFGREMKKRAEYKGPTSTSKGGGNSPSPALMFCLFSCTVPYKWAVPISSFMSPLGSD